MNRNHQGNPERSRQYTGGTCRDYWSGLARLITSQSVPRRNAKGDGDDIVHAAWKHVENMLTYNYLCLDRRRSAVLATNTGS